MYWLKNTCKPLNGEEEFFSLNLLLSLSHHAKKWLAKAALRNETSKNGPEIRDQFHTNRIGAAVCENDSTLT